MPWKAPVKQLLWKDKAANVGEPSARWPRPRRKASIQLQRADPTGWKGSAGRLGGMCERPAGLGWACQCGPASPHRISQHPPKT
jgi:hypothetical protein